MTHRVLDRDSAPEHRRRIDRARLVAELRHLMAHCPSVPDRLRFQPGVAAVTRRAWRLLGRPESDEAGAGDRIAPRSPVGGAERGSAAPE